MLSLTTILSLSSLALSHCLPACLSILGGGEGVRADMRVISVTEHDADQCNVLAQNVASHYYLIVLLPCLTFSQQFHNNFSTISQQFHNNFSTISQQFHNNFSTISQQFHNIHERRNHYEMLSNLFCLTTFIFYYPRHL